MAVRVSLSNRLKLTCSSDFCFLSSFCTVL
uniref:Uncharacterized protein n=1 Tax=Anguilla anguilla TaxID=7936 RepID=A0A0E9S4R2_ANGAN